jgi:DNA polymerase I-like protein with 3'-5' exonuclease and polymerase domains
MEAAPKYFVVDCETELIAPNGFTIPAFAAAGWVRPDGVVELTQDYAYAQQKVREAFADGYVVVGHNITFDLDVLGVVPAREHLVWDTMVYEMLARLAADDCGEDHPQPPVPKSLDFLSGGTMEGKDDIRLSYRSGHVMTEQQRRYLHADVIATQQLYLKQIVRGSWAYDELNLQVRARLALSVIERTGIPVDDEAIQMQEREYTVLKHEAACVMRDSGVWQEAKIGPRGGKFNAKVLTKVFAEHVKKVIAEMGEKPLYTDKGHLQMDKQVLNQLTHDPVVKNWLIYKSCEKLLSTYLKVWRGAGVIHARYRLLMRSGRTSSHTPNLQQVPSRGDRANIKKVFRAPPGRFFYELDYSQLELCCLAYLTRGEMLRRINAGEDLHRYLATVYFSKPADTVTKEERQLMKCANFGLPGGMGTKTFRIFIRANGLPDPGEDGARDLRNAWLAAYPEMTRWLEDPDSVRFDRTVRQVWGGKDTVTLEDDAIEAAWEKASEVLEELGGRVPVWMHRRLRAAIDKGEGAAWVEAWLVQRKVVVDGGRTRCPVSYTEQHNTRFQGLAANLTKDALARVVFEMPVHCLVHAFIHDAVLISVPESPMMNESANIAASKMLEATTKWLPGVRCEVEVSGPGMTWHGAKKAESWKRGVE